MTNDKLERLLEFIFVSLKNDHVALIKQQPEFQNYKSELESKLAQVENCPETLRLAFAQIKTLREQTGILADYERKELSQLREENQELKSNNVCGNRMLELQRENNTLRPIVQALENHYENLKCYKDSLQYSPNPEKDNSFTVDDIIKQLESILASQEKK